MWGKGPLLGGSQDGGLGAVGPYPKGLSIFQQPSQADVQPQETSPLTEATGTGWGDSQWRQKGHWAVLSGQTGAEVRVPELAQGSL